MNEKADDKTLQTVQRLADREAIRDVLMRYSRGVDRHDLAALKSCYHPDSYDDHGHFKGNGQEFAEYILGSLVQRTHHTSHTVLNHVIEMDKDPDRAHAESYGVAYLRRTDDKGAEWLDIFSGRYVDVFSRRAGEWRILSRTVVHDWSFSQRLDPGSSFPLQISNFIQGQRGGSDFVYQSREGKFPQPVPRRG